MKTINVDGKEREIANLASLVLAEQDPSIPYDWSDWWELFGFRAAPIRKKSYGYLKWVAKRNQAKAEINMYFEINKCFARLFTEAGEVTLITAKDILYECITAELVKTTVGLNRLYSTRTLNFSKADFPLKEQKTLLKLSKHFSDECEALVGKIISDKLLSKATKQKFLGQMGIDL